MAREVAFEISCKRVVIDLYRADIFVDGKVIFELKAVEEPHPRHTAQSLSCLKASGLRLGLLVNFGKDRIQIVRRVHEHLSKQ